MLNTNDLSVKELLETCQTATLRANAAEERIRAWGVLNKAIKLLVASYMDNDAIPTWIGKLSEYVIQLQGDRVQKLDEIAKNCRADAHRCLEVYEIRGDK